MKLVTKQNKYYKLNWHNDLTSEMNNHLKQGWKENFKKECTFGTYLYCADREENHIAIRFPGATRGHIELDENKVIKNIVLYDTAYENCISCYEKSVEDALKKFIGCKIFIVK